MDYSTFETTVGVKFTDYALLQTAFTHRSYINENKELKLEHNERLEFLGDAVVELLVTDFLFKKFPEKPEGELTSFRAALVNANTLSDLAQQLGMNEYLLLSKGEAKDTGRARQYILANTFESVVGAMYLDLGLETVAKFLENHLYPLIDEIIKTGSWIDAKSKFQEKAQFERSITPTYTLVKETGPDHDKRFEVAVCIGSEQIALGVGKSKQEAEQQAAHNGLVKMGWD